MRKVIIVIALCTLASVAWATGTEESPDAAESSQIRVIYWGNQSRADKTTAVIDAFVAENPEVAIESEFRSWRAYWEKLASEAAAGTMPDVLQMNAGGNFLQYSERGLLADLSPFQESGRLDLSNASAAEIESGMIGERLFGVALGTNALALVYDPGLFNQAGVEFPGPSLTWESYYDKAVAVHEALNIWGSGNLPTSNFFEYYLACNGRELIAPDGSTLGFEDAYLEEFLVYILQMSNEGVVMGPDEVMERTGMEQSPIVAGQAPTVFIWSNQLAAVSELSGKPLSITSPPGPGVERGLTMKPAMFFSVSDSSTEDETAVSFIDYFVNSIEANRILMMDRGVPISSEVRAALLPDLDDTQQKMVDYISFVSRNSSPWRLPHPKNGEVVDALADIQQQVLFELMTPSEAAAAFRLEAEAILSR
jgi:multiple sugar transport system substrate-binding protein